MNNYLVAIEGMKRMFEDTAAPMDHFNKKQYMGSFERTYQGFVPTFDAIEELYNSVIEPEQTITNMANALVECAVEKMNSTKKREKEIMLMNLNMQLAVYIYPSILHYKGNSSQPLADHIQQRWKEEFPKSNVVPAEVEYIEKGFHKKFCYITTAVCETLGKGDRCYELEMLREYRDSYLANREDGAVLIARYYDVAPTIVKHIGTTGNAEEIYRGIYDSYIDPCIRLIEQGENEACCDRYKDMVDDLKDRYFFS